MDNLRIVDQETITLVQDEDYDDDNTPNTSRVDETSFTGPEATDATSKRQKVKQDKITRFFKHLNVASDPGLADIDQFMIKKYSKTATLNCFF